MEKFIANNAGRSHMARPLSNAFFAIVLLAAFVPPLFAACQYPYQVGFRIMSFAPERNMAVWYPSSATESAYNYTPSFAGMAAEDGPPLTACGRFPLIVFSHAYGGCGIQLLTFTEELARHGYVVLAPDHADASCHVDGSGSLNIPPPQQSFLSPQDWTPATYIDRRDDLESALAQAMASSDLAPVIDTNRIGAAGHSLGGYSVFGLAGAWAEWKDPRIKAALAFSPYINPFLIGNRLAQITAPVMYQGGTLDLYVTPFLTGSGGAMSLTSIPKFFVELNNATHFEWTDIPCGNATTVAACLTTAPNAAVINAYGIGFFEYYLRGLDASVLASRSPSVYDYERLTSFAAVSSASFLLPARISTNEIVAGFGLGLADESVAANELPLPGMLASTTVNITDSTGVQRIVSLFYVSPQQINFLVPQATAPGPASIVVSVDGSAVAQGNVQVQEVSPGLYSADGSGSGVAAAYFLRVSADGTTQTGLVFDANTRLPVSIDLGPQDDQIYLSLYGTGLRNATSPATATAAGIPVPVLGIYALPQFAGLDQINIGPLPRTLLGAGRVKLILSVEGQTANTVDLVIQ